MASEKTGAARCKEGSRVALHELTAAQEAIGPCSTSGRGLVLTMVCDKCGAPEGVGLIVRKEGKRGRKNEVEEESVWERNSLKTFVMAGG